MDKYGYFERDIKIDSYIGIEFGIVIIYNVKLFFKDI